MFSVMKCTFACDTNWRNTLLVPVEGLCSGSIKTAVSWALSGINLVIMSGDIIAGD